MIVDEFNVDILMECFFDMMNNIESVVDYLVENVLLVVFILF